MRPALRTLSRCQRQFPSMLLLLPQFFRLVFRFSCCSFDFLCKPYPTTKNAFNFGVRGHGSASRAATCCRDPNCLGLSPVRERESVPRPCGFEQKPRATLGFIDPDFDETCRRDVTMVVTHVVHFAETCDQRFVVVHQLGQHVQWLHVVSVVIEHPLSTRDLSNRMEREPADLANAFRDDVGHCEELFGVFIEKQMIIAEMMPTHMPVKILSFHIKREDVR